MSLLECREADQRFGMVVGALAPSDGDWLTQQAHENGHDEERFVPLGSPDGSEAHDPDTKVIELEGLAAYRAGFLASLGKGPTAETVTLLLHE